VTDSPAGREPADSDAVAHVFVDELGERCHIEGDDGHHLSRVRRVRTGELVTAADGSGAWRLYEVVAVSAGALDLDARAEPCIARAPDIVETMEMRSSALTAVPRNQPRSPDGARPNPGNCAA